MRSETIMVLDRRQYLYQKCDACICSLLHKVVTMGLKNGRQSIAFNFNFISPPGSDESATAAT